MKKNKKIKKYLKKIHDFYYILLDILQREIV